MDSVSTCSDAYVPSEEKMTSSSTKSNEERAKTTLRECVIQALDIVLGDDTLKMSMDEADNLHGFLEFAEHHLQEAAKPALGISLQAKRQRHAQAVCESHFRSRNGRLQELVEQIGKEVMKCLSRDLRENR